jgi:hypothetical protein
MALVGNLDYDRSWGMQSTLVKYDDLTVTTCYRDRFINYKLVQYNKIGLNQR